MIYHVTVTKNATLELGKPCPVCGAEVAVISTELLPPEAAKRIAKAGPCGCKMVYHEPPMTLEQFALEHGLTLQYSVWFKNAATIGNYGIHERIQGSGMSPAEAIRNYASFISGRQMVVDGKPTIEVPELRIEE